MIFDVRATLEVALQTYIRLVLVDMDQGTSSRVVYELLCVPAKYEQLIQSHETQYLDEEIPFHVKIRELRR